MIGVFLAWGKIAFGCFDLVEVCLFGIFHVNGSMGMQMGCVCSEKLLTSYGIFLLGGYEMVKCFISENVSYEWYLSWFL